MRQFHNRGWDYTPVDIVIEPDGQVWVSITEPKPFVWNAYEKIEDLRAKDYRRPGNPRDRARKGSSRRSGRASDGYAWCGYHFDESCEYTPEPDFVVEWTFRPDVM